MRPVGALDTLTCNWWDAEPPEPGDFLRTRSGRCYVIESKSGRRLRCRVLEKDAVQFGEPGVWFWEWASRNRKA